MAPFRSFQWMIYALAGHDVRGPAKQRAGKIIPAFERRCLQHFDRVAFLQNPRNMPTGCPHPITCKTVRDRAAEIDALGSAKEDDLALDPRNLGRANTLNMEILEILAI